MTEAFAERPSEAEAQAEINRLVAKIERGEEQGWEESEAVSIAEPWEFDVEAIRRRFGLARQFAQTKTDAEALDVSSLFLRPTQPPAVESPAIQPDPSVVSEPSVISDAPSPEALPSSPAPSLASKLNERLNRIGAKPEPTAVARRAKLAELGLVASPKPDEVAAASPQDEAGDEAEPEAVPGDLGNFADVDEEHPDEEAVLNPAAPYDSAREYTRRFCFREGFLATYYWDEGFWQWNGLTYEKMNGDALRASVYRFLDRSWKHDGKGGEFQMVRFRPKPDHVNALIDGLKSGLALAKDWYPPMWLDTRQKASSVWVFANGVLDIETGELRKPSPRLWVHGAVDFDWNPEAKCPVWDRYLDEVFPGDQESQQFIEVRIPMMADTCSD
jgi:hypothetical protein